MILTTLVHLDREIERYGFEPETAGVEDPVASIRFAGVGCARTATVGEESVKSGNVVGCSEADGVDGGVFSSLAAHPY